VRELSRAQKLAPDNTDIAIELGRAQAELGQWKDVEAQSQRIHAKSPRSAMGTYLRAIARLGQGKPEEALALADEATKGEGTLPPDLPPVRAEALVRLGKVPEAEQAYRAALATNPKDRRSLAGLAALELREKKFAEAKQHYSEALALAPQDPRVRLGLAAATASQGNVKEAIKILEGVDARARSVGVLVALGNYYLRDNRPNEAIAVLSPVVAQLPQFGSFSSPARISRPDRPSRRSPISRICASEIRTSPLSISAWHRPIAASVARRTRSRSWMRTPSVSTSPPSFSSSAAARSSCWAASTRRTGRRVKRRPLRPSRPSRCS
jgi:tetratricopeptide (TPR) repeat protein